MIGGGVILLAVLAHTATHGEAEEDCEAPSSAETSAEQQSESLPLPCHFLCRVSLLVSAASPWPCSQEPVY